MTFSSRIWYHVEGTPTNFYFLFFICFVITNWTLNSKLHIARSPLYHGDGTISTCGGHLAGCPVTHTSTGNEGNGQAWEGFGKRAEEPHGWQTVDQTGDKMREP